MIWNYTSAILWRSKSSSRYAAASASASSSWWQKPWIRHWRHRLQLRYQLWVLDWTVPDGVEGYPPLTLYDAAASTTPTTVNRSDPTITTTITTEEITIMRPYDWKTSDDRVIGGFSTSDISIVMPTVQQQQQQQPPSEPPPPPQQQPFLRWRGNIDTTVGLVNQNRHVVHRSGYCALYQPMAQPSSSSSSFLTAAAPSMDLGGNYSALEIQARMMIPHHHHHYHNPNSMTGTGGPRTVTVNLTVANSTIPEDMYQGEMRFIIMDPTTRARTNTSTTTTNHHISASRRLMDPTAPSPAPTSSTTTTATFSSSTTTTTTTTTTSTITQGHTNRPDAAIVQPQPNDDKDPTTASSSSSLFLLNPLQMPFESFVLPFASFRVTSRGRERYILRRLDDRIVLQSIGFIIKDQINGPFCFDLRTIRAVNLNADGTAIVEE